MNLFIKDQALLSIWEGYDAYYFANKYGEESTHKKEFERLRELLKDDEPSQRALNWISYYYDCYYKEEYTDMNNDNPFYYIQYKLQSKECKENKS